MVPKNLLLGAFAVLTIVLMSTTLVEYSQASELRGRPAATVQVTTTVTATQTELVSSTISASSGVATDASGAEVIQLAASVEPGTATPGRNITVVATVSDALSTSVQLESQALTNPAYGPCEQSFITYVDVYYGHYASSNLSGAKPLLLYDPSGLYACPTAGFYRYTFTPGQPVNETSVVGGYWTGSGQSYAFQPFQQGDYTVVVSDAWGQRVYGYFAVA